MKTTEFIKQNWHDASKELPTESGLYYTFDRIGFINTHIYSAVHQLFNSHDMQDENEAYEYKADVLYWAKPEWNDLREAGEDEN